MKQSKNGTIITKISEKQRKERWLKYGMILSAQNCEIKKTPMNIDFSFSKSEANKSQLVDYGPYFAVQEDCPPKWPLAK